MGATPDIDHRQPEWDHLTNFLGAYFHQDFDLEYSQPWEAVLDYRTGANRERAMTLASQVRRILALRDDDRDLEKAVESLGMHYDPTADGYSSYRYWLTAVADFLEDPVSHPGPPERDAPGATAEGAGGRVSTFTDEEVAEQAITENLEGNRVAIEAWRRAAGPNRAFEWTHDHVVGRLAPPEATLDTIHDVDRSRVILRRTTQAAEGWFVMVGYPVAPPDPAVAAAVDRTAPEWDGLWTLCGGYLHQDFDIHGGVEGAVSTFEAEAPHAVRRSAATAVRRLLDGGDEAYLAAATEWLGMDYHPPGDGRTHREWLTALAEQLER